MFVFYEVDKAAGSFAAIWNKFYAPVSTNGQNTIIDNYEPNSQYIPI